MRDVRGIRVRTAISRRIACMAALLLGSLLMTVSAWAEPSIARVFAYAGNPVVWYVNGLEGENGNPQNISASIGNVSCEVTFGDVHSLKNVKYRTVILLDNSLSISAENREKARTLISQIIQNHTEREEFRIYTFDKTLHEVGSGTDYAGLEEAVEQIEFHDQDAYLIDCLVRTLKELSQNRDYNYDRIILMSDGVDDNKLGWTYEELLHMLDDDTYRCPIYTVASIWEKDTSGLKNMQSVSRHVDAQTYVLDEIEDVSEAAAELTKDYAAKYFSFAIPYSERTGEEREIALRLTTNSEINELDRVVKIPQLTQEERAEIEATEAVTEDSAEPETRIHAETATEAMSEKITESTDLEMAWESEGMSEAGMEKGESFLKEHLFLLICILASVLLILLVVFLLIRRRKREKSSSSVEKDLERFRQELLKEKEQGRVQQGGNDEDQRTIDEYTYDADQNEKTEGIWDIPVSESCGKGITLTDVEDPGNKYEIRLRDEIVIGRDSLCSVVIAKDRTVSGNHCKMFLENGEVMIEDMDSHNGTSVNGVAIHTSALLYTGDEIKMGKTRLRIEIH